MKLQFKLLFAFIISSFISIISSFLIVNLLVSYFDKSYNRFDIEKLSIEIISEINSLRQFNVDEISKVLKKWKTRYNNIDFTFIDDANNPVFSTGRFNIERKDGRNIVEMEKHIEQEQKKINEVNFRNFKFLDYFDNRDMLILKPVIFNSDLKGALILSVKKDFSPPFTIRINKEKKYLILVILILVIALLIFFSYILVFLFTMPVVKRLNIVFNKISNFEINKVNAKTYDTHNDEIGSLSNTFDIMADKINQDYNDKMRFFKERQELLKNVSHDFRTPLTSILGYAVTLDEGMYENEDEQKKYYKIIRKKSEYMTELFDEMMELSRLDSNTYVLKRKDFDMSELVRELIIEYLPQLEKDSFFIETDIPESVVINGDRDRLSRAVRNIIDNVIKHGNAGRYIGFKIHGIKTNEIEISISDKGKGLGPEEIDRIFERFYHGSNQGGMGLGLSIAKEIIEKHDGSIKAANSPEGGALFIIILPVKPKSI
jgi:signal transduction histidine kinase